MVCCVKVARLVDEVDESLRSPEKSELGCDRVSAFSLMQGCNSATQSASNSNNHIKVDFKIQNFTDMSSMYHVGKESYAIPKPGSSRSRQA